MPALFHTPTKIIQYLLVAGAQGVLPTPTGTQDWRVYAHAKSDDADEALFVMGPPGVLEGKDMREGVESRHYGIQILTRAKDPEVGGAKALAVQKYLTEDVSRTTVTISGHSYLVQSLTMTSDLIPLGQEENKRRSVFSSNFTATIEEV